MRTTKMRIIENFGTPEFLHWLWSVPPIILLSLFGIRQKQKARERFHSTPAPIYARRHKIQSGLLIVSYLLVTFAIAQPQFGEKQEPVQQQAVDIMLALDISTSMLAQDPDNRNVVLDNVEDGLRKDTTSPRITYPNATRMTENRLSRAKRAMFSLIEAMQGNRIGLLLFAEASFVVCPLTTDASTLKEFVAAVETETLLHSGTQIGNAIEAGVARLNRERNSAHKALILSTDGEDHGGTAIEAAKAAVSTGVHVYCIGVGTPGKPVPIPLPVLPPPENQKSRNGQRPFRVTQRDVQAPTHHSERNAIDRETEKYKRNVSGQLVLTELGEETLREVAAQGQGRYYHETEIFQQSGQLAGELAQLATRQFKVGRSDSGYAERFQLFVGIAIFLLIAEMCVSLQKNP